MNFFLPVALRKESVDRNWRTWSSPLQRSASLSARRAWIEILILPGKFVCFGWSLSARRAWIEMKVSIMIITIFMSLSARRAWIEIIVSVTANVDGFVALRKESVDRNAEAIKPS